MAQETDKVRGSFLGWIIANFLGIAALGALRVIFPFLKSIPGLLAPILIIGVPIGLAQWIALRRHAPISILWVITVSTGMLLSILVIYEVPERTWGLIDDESIAMMAGVPAIIGYMVGLIQWFLLRRQFSNSLVWPLGSAVGLGLAAFLVLASGLIDQSGIISSIVAVLVYASATGLALEWLHRQPGKSHSRLPSAT